MGPPDYIASLGLRILHEGAGADSCSVLVSTGMPGCNHDADISRLEYIILDDEVESAANRRLGKHVAIYLEHMALVISSEGISTSKFFFIQDQSSSNMNSLISSPQMPQLSRHHESLPTMHCTGPELATMLVDLAIENQTTRIGQQVGGDEPFFVADLGQVIRQYQCWTRNLPNVRPYYGRFDFLTGIE